MADLDGKYIQNLDKSIISMNNTLQNLNETLKGVKSSMVAAFDPNIVTSYQNAVRGLKIGKLIDAEGSTEDIDKVYQKMRKYGAQMKSGVKWEFLSPEMIKRTEQELAAIEAEIEKVAGKRLSGTARAERKRLYDERDRLIDILSSEEPVIPVKLTAAEKVEATELYRQYHDLFQNMSKGSAQRVAELANLQKQEEKAKKAEEDALKPKRATERTRILNKNARETQKIQEEATATLQKRKELEEQLNKLKPNGKKWREVNTELEAVNKQVSEYIAKLGSLGGAGQRQLDAFRSAGLLTANDNKQSAIEKEQIGYIKKRNALLKANANIQENIRNRRYAGNADEAFEVRMESIINRNLRSIADYDKKILADRKNFTQTTLDEITRLERQHANDLTVIAQRSADERAKIDQKVGRELEAEKKRAEKEKSDAENQRIKEAQANNKAETAAYDKLERAQTKARTAEHRAGFTEGYKKIDNESIANLKRQAELKQQITKIDHDRQLRAKSGAQASQQQLEAEKKLYSQLQSELSKLIAQQKEREKQLRGTTAQANSKLGGYFGRLESQEAQRYARLIRENEKNLASLERQARKTKDTFSSILPTLQRLASAFGVAFSVQGLVQFGKKIIETRGKFEKQFVAMQQIVQDTDAATKIWNQTMQQAFKSPFTAMQLTDYTKKLAAYRIETDKLFDTTKRLADVSAGLGVDMSRLILAYGQVKSANFLRASEVRQFTEAGVNIYGELAKYLSEVNQRMISTSEVAEMVQKRMVSFADVEEIFKRMTDEGGIFFNMQEVQADTVWGQLRKLHDAYDQMLNTIGQANQGTIRDLIERINELVLNWRTVYSFLKKNVTALIILLPLLTTFRKGAKLNSGVTVTWKESMELLSLSFKRNAKYANMTRMQYAKLRLSTIAGTTALNMFTGAVNIAKTALRTFVPFLVLEGIIYFITKAQAASKAAKQLQEDLSKIKAQNSANANDEVANFKKLVTRYNELNQGSVERSEIISKLNSQYGKYIGFQITETTTLEQLAEAQERVNKNIWENARAKAEEEERERLSEEVIRKETKAFKANNKGNTQLFYDRLILDGKTVSNVKLTTQEAKGLAEYVKLQLQTVGEEVLSSASDMDEKKNEWLRAYFGLSQEAFIAADSELSKLLDLYIDVEKRVRNVQEDLYQEFAGMDAASQKKISQLNADVATAIAQLTKAKVGDEIELPLLDNLKIKVPTDLGEKSGIFEAIKEEINRRQDDFIIDLKFSNKLISEEQRDELKNQAKSTGDVFVDKVNEVVADNILKSAGIEQSFDELKKTIIDNPDQIEDWESVNHVIELVNKSLISSSDIVNGTSNYVKELTGNIEIARTAIDDAVRAQGLIVDGTEEEVQKAQEAVNKAQERYRWLLRIAKLLGVTTKPADEIVAEEGYALNVGQFRKEALQQAFYDKFGVESNSYGMQLSNLKITDNLKATADAYHKQDEELKLLIANKEKALEVETNLNEERKATERQEIENLKSEQQKAEFIATFLGYTAEKKTSNRTQHKDFSALLDIIKKMNSEYKKLSKSAYGYSKSIEVVKKNYQAAFESILGKNAKALVNWDKFDFTTTEGVYKALQELEDSLTKRRLWGQYGENIKKLQDQLKREIAEKGTEVDIELNVRIREDFGRQMEEAFGNYELTLDLQKLNLPQGLAAEMWGIDALDLSQLRNKLNEEYQKLKDENSEVDEDDFKKYENFLKKIDDYEQKQQRERLKDYAKYLEYQYSERTKLEMEYVRKVAQLNAETSLTDEQRASIRKGLDREFAEASKKQDWEDFKSSEFYVQMMEDLEKQGTASLEVMKGKLIEMRQNAENLPPRALKEVVNALEKIEEIESSRVAPLRRVREEMQKLQDVDMEEVYRKQAENNKAIAQNEEELRQLDRMVMLENERNRLKEQGITEKEARHNVDLARERVNMAQRALDNFEVTDGKDDTQLLSTLKETLNNEKSTLEQAERVLAIITGRAVVSAQEEGNKYAGMSISELNAQKKALEENKETLDKNSAEYQELINIEERLEKAWDDLYNSIKDYAQRLTSVFDNIMDAVDYFTDNTYGMTSAWKEFGDTASSALTELVDGIQAFQTAYETLKKTQEDAGLAQALMSGDLIKLALVVLGVIIKIVQAIAKLHDANLDKEIQKQQEKIEALQRAYERLEKQIERTFDTASYMAVYNQQVENLREQIEALERQRAAEEAKKNTDKSQVQAYTDSIQEIEDKLAELQEEQKEVFGGIGKDNYRSVAEEFVTAWKDAFLETGDGLDGLQEHFDEFLQDWFIKQATMRVAEKMLNPLLDQIDTAVLGDGQDGANVNYQELQAIREKFAEIAPQLSEALENLFGMWGFEDNGSLSGLAAGIQGMTEEQANILEAYWNSVRMYTASIDANVIRIADILENNGVNTNPQLQQLKLIANNTTAINSLLQGVVKSGHSSGGSGIKVFMN